MDTFISKIYVPICKLFDATKPSDFYKSNVDGEDFTQEELRVLCQYAVRSDRYEAFKYYVSMWDPYNAYHVHCLMHSALLSDYKYVKFLMNSIHPIKFLDVLCDLLFHMRSSRQSRGYDIPYRSYADMINRDSMRYEFDRYDPFPLDYEESEDDPFYIIKEMRTVGASDREIIDFICKKYPTTTERASADVFANSYDESVIDMYEDIYEDDHVDYTKNVYAFKRGRFHVVDIGSLSGKEKRKMRNKLRNRMKRKMRK